MAIDLRRHKGRGGGERERVGERVREGKRGGEKKREDEGETI